MEQAAPFAPSGQVLARSELTQLLPLQQLPAALHDEASQTQLAEFTGPIQCWPIAHAAPVLPQTHCPPAQLLDLLSQAMQAPPLVAHPVAGLSLWQIEPVQQDPPMQFEELQSVHTPPLQET